jgi:hypothetical protein
MPSDTTSRRGLFERPDTPAQAYAVIAGLFLVALGVLSLIFEPVDFGSVGNVAGQPQFLIWAVSGWTTILWIVMGGLGLVSAGRLDSARTYALFAGVVFAVACVWGFIDGNNVASLIAADTTNNITHGILAALGLLTGLMPRRAQRPREERFVRSAPATRERPRQPTPQH